MAVTLKVLIVQSTIYKGLALKMDKIGMLKTVKQTDCEYFWLEYLNGYKMTKKDTQLFYE